VNQITYLGWEKKDLISAIENAHVVVNLAGTSIGGTNLLPRRWTENRKRKLIESRVKAGSLISTAINEAKNKPDIFVQASAIGYYGNTGGKVANENEPPGQDFLAEICQEWEGSTRNVEALGVRRLVIRIGLVFSNEGGLLRTLMLPFSLFLGGKIGTGKQYFSWIHIDDLVSSLIFLVENNNAGGVYNLTGPNPVQNQTFVEVLSQVMKKPGWFSVPGFALKILLGEAATLALDGRAVQPSRLLEEGYSFKYEQLMPALNDLI
jgi:uncharacterized protein (TIGR01777 family)